VGVLSPWMLAIGVACVAPGGFVLWVIGSSLLS
jgi:hypothetical protein